MTEENHSTFNLYLRTFKSILCPLLKSYTGIICPTRKKAFLEENSKQGDTLQFWWSYWWVDNTNQWRHQRQNVRERNGSFFRIFTQSRQFWRFVWQNVPLCWYHSCCCCFGGKGSWIQEKYSRETIPPSSGATTDNLTKIEVRTHLFALPFTIRKHPYKSRYTRRPIWSGFFFFLCAFLKWVLYTYLYGSFNSSTTIFVLYLFWKLEQNILM